MASLRGPLEARILAAERRQLRLEDEIRTARREIVALNQGIWSAWAESGLPIGVAAPTPSTPCTADFSAICPCVPLAITLDDSYYGDVTLTYVPASLAWLGCNVVTLPSNASCTGPVTFALHYALTGSNATNSWSLVCQYKVANFTTHCPVASTCADAPNQSLNLTIAFNCSGTSLVSFAANGTVPGTQAWPSFRTVTLSITLP